MLSNSKTSKQEFKDLFHRILSSRNFEDKLYFKQDNYLEKNIFNKEQSNLIIGQYFSKGRVLSEDPNIYENEDKIKFRKKKYLIYAKNNNMSEGNIGSGGNNSSGNSCVISKAESFLPVDL